MNNSKLDKKEKLFLMPEEDRRVFQALEKREKKKILSLLKSLALTVIDLIDESDENEI